MIRILLVDDQALLCEVLKTWLEVEDDFQVVGIAHNGEEALARVETLQPDIVLMDIDMPEMDGLHATTIICQRFPYVKVIFLSAHDNDTYLGQSLRAGAKGYLLKNTTAEELAEKIRSVYKESEEVEIENDENLVVIKTQLEKFLGTYQQQFQEQIIKIETALAEVNKVIDSNTDYEKRLSQLESLNQSGWEAMHSEIINVQNQFGETNRTLSAQMNQQLVNLKRELDSQLATAIEDWSRQRAALQEWAVQRDEMRPGGDELESKYRQELMTAINPMRSSFRDLDKQIQFMRNGVIASIIISAMALSFAGILFVSNLFSTNSESSIKQVTQTSRK
jgi:YesN/AraC family two-component response regulator